jgi:DNA-binding transcriptional LysR family regulator
MQSREIQCFVKVAEFKSFSAAGDVLGLTQQAVSRMIAGIETRYSVKLFARNTRKVDLTAQGEALLAKALPAYAEIVKLTQWLDAQRKESMPTIRVGYTMSARRLVLDTLLPKLKTLGLDAVYSELPSAQQENDLLQGRLDVGFLHTPLSQLQLKHLSLFTEKMLVVLPPKHRYASRKSLSLSELHNELWMLFDRDQGPDLYQKIITKLTDASGKKPTIKGHLMPHPVRADMSLKHGCVTLIASAAVSAMQESAAFVPCSDISLPTALAWNPSASHSARDRLLDLHSFLATNQL